MPTRAAGELERRTSIANLESGEGRDSRRRGLAAALRAHDAEWMGGGLARIRAARGSRGRAGQDAALAALPRGLLAGLQSAGPVGIFQTLAQKRAKGGSARCRRHGGTCLSRILVQNLDPPLRASTVTCVPTLTPVIEVDDVLVVHADAAGPRRTCRWRRAHGLRGAVDGVLVPVQRQGARAHGVVRPGRDHIRKARARRRSDLCGWGPGRLDILSIDPRRPAPVPAGHADGDGDSVTRCRSPQDEIELPFGRAGSQFCPAWPSAKALTR